MTRFLFAASTRMAVMFMLAVLATTSSSAQSITTFDPPNSTKTVAQAINIFGQITGYYNESGVSGTYSFIRQRDGTFIKFRHGGPLFYQSTLATDINSAGQVVGYYVEGIANSSFLRQRDGTIVNLNVSPANQSSPSAAVTEPPPSEYCSISFGGPTAVSINAFGQITGQVGERCRGILWQPDGTSITFDVLPQFQVIPETAPQAINFFGQITGWYRDTNGFDLRGFVRKPNGTIIRFDVPNSGHTVPQAINFFGQITGYYRDTNFVPHAFLRQPNGKIITFDPTGSVGTQAMAINLTGEITGFYATVDGIYHGFLRRPNGKIETFDVAGTGNGGTFPKHINDFGQIVGFYQDANFVLHGFVRSAH